MKNDHVRAWAREDRQLALELLATAGTHCVDALLLATFEQALPAYPARSNIEQHTPRGRPKAGERPSLFQRKELWAFPPP